MGEGDDRPHSASTGRTSRPPARKARPARPGARTGSAGVEAIVVRFPAEAFRPFPVRDVCTHSDGRGRQLSIRPRPRHGALKLGRATQSIQKWKARYAARSGKEGTISQAVAVTGIRRVRYIYVLKLNAVLHLSKVDPYI
ncbi:transposase [Microtetraspora fusca]|uniref:Transposase n=1 Tax=Microtetraspora fusca TaxID=1997 RepID=A0ABW6V926_MICFU